MDSNKNDLLSLLTPQGQRGSASFPYPLCDTAAPCLSPLKFNTSLFGYGVFSVLALRASRHIGGGSAFKNIQSGRGDRHP